MLRILVSNFTSRFQNKGSLLGLSYQVSLHEITNFRSAKSCDYSIFSCEFCKSFLKIRCFRRFSPHENPNFRPVYRNANFSPISSIHSGFGRIFLRGVGTTLVATATTNIFQILFKSYGSVFRKQWSLLFKLNRPDQ